MQRDQQRTSDTSTRLRESTTSGRMNETKQGQAAAGRRTPLHPPAPFRILRSVTQALRVLCFSKYFFMTAIKHRRGTLEKLRGTPVEKACSS